MESLKGPAGERVCLSRIQPEHAAVWNVGLETALLVASRGIGRRVRIGSSAR